MPTPTEAAELGIAKAKAARAFAATLSQAFRARLQAENPALVSSFDQVMAAQDAWHEAFAAGLRGVHEA